MPDDTQRGRVRVETAAKRVRAYLDGEVIADSTRPHLVWEVPYYPTYYFPVEDVATEHLVPTGESERVPSRGVAEIYDVKGSRGTAEGAARRFPDSPMPPLRELVRLEWAAMDAWFEEDEEVHVHPRDPYTRIDVLNSSRHVEIRVDGTLVADSRHPTLLFETGLPARFYLPKPDVRFDLLVPTATVSHCPYKGTAEYWSVRIDGKEHRNLAWSYRSPIPESQKIAGLVAFFDEKADVTVDGVLRERPRTKFS